MNAGWPNLSGLILAARHTARAMEQVSAPDDKLEGFIRTVLFSPPAEGGRELWSCFVAGIITSEELRNGLVARLATWLSDANGVDEPPSSSWCTSELEREVECALFVSRDPAARARAVAEVIATLDAAAIDGSTGAVLLLEADSRSVTLLEERRTSDTSLEDMFLSASWVAAQVFPEQLASARTSWRGHEVVLLGDRESLVERSKVLLKQLLAHRSCGRVSWRLVLTRIFPGDARRTRYADPAYDLASAQGSFVAWVDPYTADDWQQPQRYPTTTVVFEP